VERPRQGVRDAYDTAPEVGDLNRRRGHVLFPEIAASGASAPRAAAAGRRPARPRSLTEPERLGTTGSAVTGARPAAAGRRPARPRSLTEPERLGTTGSAVTGARPAAAGRRPAR